MEVSQTSKNHSPSSASFIFGVIIAIACIAAAFFVLSWYRVGVMKSLMWLSSQALWLVILGFLGMIMLVAFYIGIAGYALGFTLRLVKNENIRFIAFAIIGLLSLYFGIRIIIDAWKAFDFQFTKQILCFVIAVYSLFGALFIGATLYQANEFVVDKAE